MAVYPVAIENEPAASLRARAEIALERVRRRLLEEHHPDGHWCAKPAWNHTVTAEYVFLTHMFDPVDATKQSKCVAFMKRSRLT